MPNLLNKIYFTQSSLNFASKIYFGKAISDKIL